MNYETMTIEELEKVIQDLGNQRDALKAEQQMAHKALDEKINAAAAAKLVANLDDAQKNALLQAIQSQGLDSAAVVKGMV